RRAVWFYRPDAGSRADRRVRRATRPPPGRRTPPLLPHHRAGAPRGAGRSRAPATPRPPGGKQPGNSRTGVRRSVADPIRYYRLLLKLYPARFREEFAAPLERQFSDEYRESHGAGQRAMFWLRTLADWAVTLPAEMLREFRQDARYAARVYRRRA